MISTHDWKGPRMVLQLLVGILLLTQTSFSQGNILTVPEDEVLVLSSLPMKWKGFKFKDTASGAKVQLDFIEVRNEGKARTYYLHDGFKSDQAAIRYHLEWPEEVEVSGAVSISGKASGAITKRRGWMNLLIQAKSKVKYADQKVIAGEGQTGMVGFALTTDRTKNGVKVLIPGDGDSFAAIWEEQVEGFREKEELGDIDAGLTRLTREAVVVLQAYAKGAMYLENKAVGEWEAEADAGALIEARSHKLSGK